jgi:hypothetical protein
MNGIAPPRSSRHQQIGIDEDLKRPTYVWHDRTDDRRPAAERVDWADHTALYQVEEAVGQLLERSNAGVGAERVGDDRLHFGDRDRCL